MSTNIDKLKNSLLETNKLFESVKKDLMEEISNIPDESGIKRINDTMFTINFSSLKNWNLSPSYYNTKGQISRILAMLGETRDIVSFKAKIDNLVSTKKIVKSNETILLNDGVLKGLETIQKKLEVF